MTPIKRGQADVQEILNHPIESHQPTLRYKKEGLGGWLSYLGFSVTVALSLAGILGQFFSYISDTGIDGIIFPFYEKNIWILTLLGLGSIFTLITIFKSPYKMSHETRLVLSIIFSICFLLIITFVFLMIPYPSRRLEFFFPLSVILLWVFLLGWYIRYFYKKSKDGYRRVWLKILIFLIIPFLPFLYYRFYVYEENYMGDVLYDPSDYGYPNE